MFQHRHWDMGSRGREVTMTALESQIRVVVEKRGSENRRGTIESPDKGIPIREETERSRRCPIPGRATRSLAISDGGRVMEEQSEI